MAINNSGILSLTGQSSRLKFARQIWRRDDVNGVRQGRLQHDRRSVIWLALAALCAAALGPVPAAAQTDEPPDPPNLRGLTLFFPNVSLFKGTPACA